MTQPPDLVYLRMIFSLNSSSGPEDEAMFGIYGNFNWTPSTDADWDSALADLATAARGNWVSDVAKTYFSPGTNLDQAKASRQNSTGHTLNEGADASTGGDWSGTASQSLPWENSLVISLYSYPRGSFTSNARRKRGRIYLPPLGTNLLVDTDTGLASISFVEAIRDDIKSWLHDVQTTNLGSSGHNWSPQILSRAAVDTYGLNYLSVDNKLDVQRRRQKSQTPQISTVAYP